jgi:hypothetical protein
MKVNPAFVSILIIATSLTIHTPVHLYLAIISTLGVLNLGSYHGPHTFSKVSSLVVIRRSELGSFQGPHTFSKVSSPFIGGHILLQLGCIKVAPKNSLPPCGLWKRSLPLIT